MSVKRYDFVIDIGANCSITKADVEVSDAGLYVTYHDYALLQSQNADLAVQLANAESKCRELAEFKSRIYAQMGVGCEAPEFSITEGLSNLRRFADTLHAIEREFFTKEVPDEECEGETVEECPLCWGMNVEQYVSEFGKCLAEVRAHGVEDALKIMGGFTSDECGDSVYIAVKDFAAKLRQGGE